MHRMNTDSYIRKQVYALSLMLCMIVSSDVLAQTNIRLLDEENQPIRAASVTVTPIGQPMAKQMLTSDQTGHVMLAITERSEVFISAIGFNATRFEIHPDESKTIQLKRFVNEINSVVITGQFDITRINSSVERVRVIDEKLIRQTSSNTLRDIISFVPNIRLSEDNVLGSNTTINGLSGQNIKVLIDGVPVAGRENGNVDLGQMQLNNIERIEITEGPMSVLYSSDASAGVINLITKKSSSNSFSSNGSVMLETPRSLYADFWVGKNMGRSHLALSGGRNYFDGFPSFNQNRNQQWNPYIKYFGTLHYGIRLAHYSNELRFSYFNQHTLNRGIPVTTPYDAYAFDQHFYISRINTSLHQDFNISNKARINWQSSYNRYSRIRKTLRTDLTTLEELGLEGSDHTDSSRVHHLFTRMLFIQNGSDRFRWQAGTELNYEFAFGDRFRNGDAFIYEVALLAQSEIRPTDKLWIKPGIRFNYNSRYRAPVIPALNIRYQLNNQLAFRMAFSRGYRTPSLKEISLLFVDANHNIYGNENLNAEDSRYGNIQMDFTKNYDYIQITLSPSLYYTHIRNQIVLAITDTASLRYQYVNLEAITSRGGNLGITFNTQQLSASFNYGLNQLESRINSAIQQIWTPEYTASLRWSLKKTGVNINVLMKNVGAAPVYYSTTNTISERSVVDGYTLADITVNKNIFHNKLSLTLGIKNLFNVTNLNAVNNNVSVHNSATGIAVARGRFLMTSVQWQIFSNRNKE